MPKIRKPRPTTCNVEGCCQPVYAPPSNPYVRQCYEHYLAAKNENRRLRNQGNLRDLRRNDPTCLMKDTSPSNVDQSCKASKPQGSDCE